MSTNSALAVAIVTTTENNSAEQDDDVTLRNTGSANSCPLTTTTLRTVLPFSFSLAVVSERKET